MTMPSSSKETCVYCDSEAKHFIIHSRKPLKIKNNDIVGVTDEGEEWRAQLCKYHFKTQLLMRFGIE